MVQTNTCTLYIETVCVYLDFCFLLVYIGIDDKIHCSVLLNSMFEPKSVQPNPRSFHEVANVLNDGPTNSLTGNKAAETFHFPTLLWIRGVINHSTICPTWLHPMKAYTCIGLECTQRVESTNSASSSMKPLSGWFQEFLLSLSKGNKLLVCKTFVLPKSCINPPSNTCKLSLSYKPTKTDVNLNHCEPSKTFWVPPLG